MRVLAINETRRRKKGKRTKALVLHSSECNFRCFQPAELKDTRIMRPDTPTAMQSAADGLWLQHEEKKKKKIKSSSRYPERRRSVRREAEAVRQGGRQMEGQRLMKQFIFQISFSRWTDNAWPSVEKNFSRDDHSFGKYMPKMSHRLNLLGFGEVARLHTVPLPV